MRARVAAGSLVGLLAVGALGCSTAPIPRDHFYRIAAEAPEGSRAPPPHLQGTLAVGRFRADGLTNERAILYRDRAHDLEVQQHRYHYWVESPTQLLQEELAGYLRARNVATTVLTPEVRVRPDYLVTGRLNRFERVVGGNPSRVLVEMRLNLVDQKGLEALA